MGCMTSILTFYSRLKNRIAMMEIHGIIGLRINMRGTNEEKS